MAFAKSMPQAYCRQCQKMVEVFAILDRGDEVVTCTACGCRLSLDPADPAYGATRKAAKPAAPREEEFLDELTSAMEIEEAQEAITLEPIEADVYYDGAMGIVLVADDEQLVRKTIANIFTDQGVAREVIHCANGGEMVKKYSEALAQSELPIGLLVIDLEMPVLNGLQTAMTIRKMEESRELMPVPILFFSGRKRDPKLDEAMKRMHPSMYMYKGEGAKGEGAQDAIRERVRKVVALLMREMNA